MKIIFHDKFYDDTYADDSAALPGRMSSIMKSLLPHYEIITPELATYRDILQVHDQSYIESVQKSRQLYNMALLSAGGAISAAKTGISGEAAFAAIRPPGHHAHPNFGWGFCHFCNMAIAIHKLKRDKKIKSAFVLDFDAHTGDGTRDCLAQWNAVTIFNPMAADNKQYLKKIDSFIKKIDHVDIVAVCAGFDSYIKDCGQKLTRFDFYKIGYMMKALAKRLGHHRRFAILEGGYYLPDLGKNVLAFCNGFE